MKARGFTLIEMMIVVAIFAIIAAVCTSAWQRHTNGQSAVLFDYNSTGVVRDQPAVDPNTRGDSVTCIGGTSYHKGAVLILNGETIKCGERK